MGDLRVRRPWGPAGFLLSLIVLLCAVPAPAAAACADEQLSTKDPAATQPRLRAAVVCLVNEARNARGLPSLAADPQLEQAAQAHTDDMADRGYFEHTTPEGKTPDQRATEAGYAWSTVAENIASGADTPFAVVERWLQSPGHCSNVLSTKMADTGVGVRQDKDLWTQVFGRRKGKPPANGPEPACPTSMGRAAGGASSPPSAPPNGVSGTAGTSGLGTAGPGSSAGGQAGSASEAVEAQGPPTLTSVRLVGKAVRVVAVCDGGGTAPAPCRLRAALTGKVGRRTMRFGTASAQVPAGQSVTFTLRPNAAGRRTLARGAGRRARLEVVLRDLQARRDLARRTLTPLRTTFR